MKNVLFIRPDMNSQGKIWWSNSANQQVDALEGWDALSTLNVHELADSVCLLLPASEIIFRHFSLPKKQLNINNTPFSWMAEETLIGDVEELHWTVMHKKGNEVDAVAIHCERLQHWLTLFQEAGLKVIQVLPDAILLPETPQGCTVVALEDNYWLRYAPFGACEADAAMLPSLLPRIGAQDVCSYGELDIDTMEVECQPWQHPLTLIQPQWQKTRCNMLHGAFSLHAHSGGLKQWRKPLAASIILALGLCFVPRISMAWLLVQQENQLQQDIVQLYQYHFPSLRQQSNIKYHLGQNVKKEKKGVFLQLEDLAKIKQSSPSVEIESVDYDVSNNRFTLIVQAPVPAAVQNFISQADELFDFSQQAMSTTSPYTAMVTGSSK